jgi:NADP-dependent 3-hydroxy acid dehydrogenase YdfG
MGSVHQVKGGMPMERGASEQVVVVTGASSGVGRAVARAFGFRRARVALVARNIEALEVCRREIGDAGGEALVCPADVADPASVERAAAHVEDRWGGIDVWVNVAMATVFAPVHETTPAEYKRVTEVSYLGYVYGTLAALRRMRPRNAGTIVQVGSALAFRSIPLQSAYCGAKAAIRAFTDSLRTELIHDGSAVRLTQVHLPAVNTPQADRQRNKMPKRQQPVPPLFSPETAADAIVWASEHAPRQMLVGLPTLKAVWGQKCIPGLLDRHLASAGWEPQFVDEPNLQTADILFDTLPGDPGAHGAYRERERGPDLQLRLRKSPAPVLALALLGIGLAAIKGWGSMDSRIP